jgi:hypothetical protein
MVFQQSHDSKKWQECYYMTHNSQKEKKKNIQRGSQHYLLSRFLFLRLVLDAILVDLLKS